MQKKVHLNWSVTGFRLRKGKDWLLCAAPAPTNRSPLETGAVSFEEAKCGARSISRKLEQIPIVQECKDAAKRRSLSKHQRVEVPRGLTNEIANWIVTHYHEYCPKELSIKPFKSDRWPERSMDLIKLKEWRDSPELREEIHNQITAHAVEAIEKQDFMNLERYAFYGAIGEAYAEINTWLRTAD